MSLTIVQARPEQVPFLWPRVAPLLDASPEVLETTTKEDIYTNVLSEMFQLWVASEVGVELYFICAVVDRPTERVYQVMFCVGHGLEKPNVWEQLLYAVGVVARGCGAQRVEAIASRAGMAKQLSSMGFRIREYVLVQDVHPQALQ